MAEREIRNGGFEDPEFQEKLLPKLLEASAESLDPNLVAAYVDGGLPPRERREFEDKMARDPEALLLVRSLQEDAWGRPRFPWRMAALAACFVVAMGLWWFGRDVEKPSAELDVRMAALTEELRDKEPGLFADFDPTNGVDSAVSNGTTRGGIRWVAPRGLLLKPPTELRWRNAAGSSRAEVVLDGGGLHWTREVEGESVAAPKLGPGRYVVAVRGLDTLAGQAVRRTFAVALEGERVRHERALWMIRERAEDDDLGKLLAAHYALQHRLFEEAREALDDVQSQDRGVRDAVEALRGRLPPPARR